jgi:hypothetical protein
VNRWSKATEALRPVPCTHLHCLALRCNCGSALKVWNEKTAQCECGPGYARPNCDKVRRPPTWQAAALHGQAAGFAVLAVRALGAMC